MSHQDVLHGNNLDLLAAVRDNFAHAVVTDPPYGLGFMGKDWDAALPDPRTWSECLRVLRPGGHLVAFGAPRLVHRLTCQIEDAGFEIRDQLLWVFGSGFPKSLDVSKAIDAAAGAEREVVGFDASAIARQNKQPTNDTQCAKSNPQSVGVITAPATPAARQWSGWGTALKPSYEPIVWAQKRLDVVPLDAIINSVTTELEAFLWSIAPARFVELCFRSSQRGSNAEAFGGARWLAAVLAGASSTSQSDATATFNSPEEASTFLSIASLWSDILGVNFSQRSTFTTSTSASMTTGLKTLRCLISVITPASTIQDAAVTAGRWWTAASAESALSERAHGPKGTPSRSAHEAVSFRIAREVLNTIVSTVEESFPHLQVTPDCSAGPLATMRIAERLSPAYEPIVLARKPLDGTVAQTVQRWGTGAINIDGCRVETDESTLRPNGAIGYGSTKEQGEGIGGSAAGRWPANLILDEDAGAMLDAQSGVRRSAGDYPSDAERGSDNATSFGGRPGKPYADSGGASRFFKQADFGEADRFMYCPKASRSEREAGLDHLPTRVVDPSREEDAAARDNPRTGAGRSGEARRNHHATVKPIDLMRWLVRLVTPPGGMVLEPFAGSGTTPAACALEDVDCLAMELDADYVEIARARVAHAVQQREEELAAKIESSRQMDLFAMEACS